MTSKIEWTDETWNPVTGCTKVSAGCANCYAERMWPRLRTGRPFTEVRCQPERLDQPLHWRKPRKVFVCSMGDLFHPDVSDHFIWLVFRIMANARQHTFQIPTKRPERMRDIMAKWWRDGLTLREGYTRRPLPNVWLLVSIEDQATANDRLIYLRDTPAAVRGVSYEPAIGLWDPIRTYAGSMNINALNWLDWVIVGGESGPKARPMLPDWARSVRDQCVAADVAFFFKQWGEWGQADSIEDLGTAHHGWWEFDSCDGGVPRQDCGGVPREVLYRVGKRHAGRELDGRTWDQYPVGGKSDD